MNAAADSPFFDRASNALAGLNLFPMDGRVRAVVGLMVEVEGIRPPLGAFCEIITENTSESVQAEVVGLRDDISLLMPLGQLQGTAVGARVVLGRRKDRVPCGEGCLGRILDGLGRPIDGLGPLVNHAWRPIESPPVGSVTRARIDEPLDLGLRALNSFATVGRGMRMGIFAGSGVGKSTLLGQLASQAETDVAVIALIGERRREVREFIERDLGDALARSVVIVSTSDESAPMRTRAARVATAIAEGFRDDDKHVLLMMDSLTRFCTAQREIGLAAGEPPTTRGFTPSVWNQLPKLLERAGTSSGRGSITGLYTVLVEGDDMNEPVADAARSLLDGHVELSRRIAQGGRFPAIDILASVSRVMPDVTSPEHCVLAQQARQTLATYRDAEDLISVGAYQEGSDPQIDRARKLEPALQLFLSQRRDEATSIDAGFEGLREILQGSDG